MSQVLKARDSGHLCLTNLEGSDIILMNLKIWVKICWWIHVHIHIIPDMANTLYISYIGVIIISGGSDPQSLHNGVVHHDFSLVLFKILANQCDTSSVLIDLYTSPYHMKNGKHHLYALHGCDIHF